MRDRRTAWIALLATAIAAVAAPGTAGAHDERFAGKVTIRENPDFHGRVTSPKAVCVGDRKVKIYREQSGPDGLLASTRTDDDGRWEYLAGQLTGDFYAKVRRTDIGPQGHDHVCKGDRSRSVSVQAPPPP